MGDFFEICLTAGRLRVESLGDETLSIIGFSGNADELFIPAALDRDFKIISRLSIIDSFGWNWQDEERKCERLHRTYDGHRITSIASGAFDERCVGLRSIHLPEEPITVYAGAFTKCETLEEIYSPCPHTVIKPGAYDTKKVKLIVSQTQEAIDLSGLTLTPSQARHRLDFWIILAVRTENKAALNRLMQLLLEQERQWITLHRCGKLHIFSRMQTLRKTIEQLQKPEMLRIFDEWLNVLLTDASFSFTAADEQLSAAEPLPRFPQDIADGFGTIPDAPEWKRGADNIEISPVPVRWIIVSVNLSMRTMRMITEYCFDGGDFDAEPTISFTDEEQRAILEWDRLSSSYAARSFYTKKERMAVCSPGALSSCAIDSRDINGHDCYPKECDTVVSSDWWLCNSEGDPWHGIAYKGEYVTSDGAIETKPAYDDWRQGHGFSGAYQRWYADLDLRAPMFQDFLKFMEARGLLPEDIRWDDPDD